MSALALLPLLLVPVLYALAAKAAAFLYRRCRLSWLHAFVLGVLLATVGTAAALLHMAVGRPLPVLLGALLSAALQVSVGAWYLGPRARSADGVALRFQKGAVLALLVFGLLVALSAGLGLIAFLVGPLKT